MNKGELIAEVQGRSSAPREVVEAVVNGTLDAIGERLAGGERVTLQGFGTFEARSRSARKGVNPATGAPIEIAATTVPAFRASIVLRRRVAPSPTPVPESAAEKKPKKKKKVKKAKKR